MGRHFQTKINCFMYLKRTFFILILVFSINISCSKKHLSTLKNTEWQFYENNISTFEVSIGDWMTYIIKSSFEDHHKPISLSEHRFKIEDKLPFSEIDTWIDYVFKSFLKKGIERTVQNVYDHCSNQNFKVLIDKSYWDTIINFRLLDLPVTNITFEQAKAYIVYKENLLNKCSGNGNKSNYKYHFKCFLPSPQQFDTLLHISDSINIKNCHLFNYKNSLCFECPNAMRTRNHPILRNIGLGPVYVWNYFPEEFGYYNYKGNVAEMTNIKGIAKGGSFLHYASEIDIGKIQSYSKPEPWLGLRVWYKVFKMKS